MFLSTIRRLLQKGQRTHSNSNCRMDALNRQRTVTPSSVALPESEVQRSTARPTRMACSIRFCRSEGVIPRKKSVTDGDFDILSDPQG